MMEKEINRDYERVEISVDERFGDCVLTGGGNDSSPSGQLDEENGTEWDVHENQ